MRPAAILLICASMAACAEKLPQSVRAEASERSATSEGQPLDWDNWTVIESAKLERSDPVVTELDGRESLYLPDNHRAYLDAQMHGDFVLEVDVAGRGMPGISLACRGADV
jgi:hypothetical protein